jgi:hypothetical protein
MTSRISYGTPNSCKEEEEEESVYDNAFTLGWHGYYDARQIILTKIVQTTMIELEYNSYN